MFWCIKLYIKNNTIIESFLLLQILNVLVKILLLQLRYVLKYL